MKSLFRRIRIVSLVVMIISILFCCGYVYAAESIAQTFVLSEENEIKGVNRNIDYIKKSDSEHMTDAVLDVFDVSENGDMILGFTDGYMNAYNQNGEFIFGLKIDNSKA
ncbi:MAG: hypothetical protein LUE94_16735, partial [Clostridiales bacterium]|nr:hypothetical protein [Clostridiales bacterium]